MSRKKSTRGWRRVLNRDLCVYCFGRSGTVEHILPVSLGGVDNWENRSSACDRCNRLRGNLSLLKWLVVLSYWKAGHRLTKRERKAMGLWYPLHLTKWLKSRMVGI